MSKTRVLRIRKGIYRHYKGRYYEVLGTARHSETLEELVVYKALYKSEFGMNSLWVRPKEMFVGKVSVGGKVIPRFKYVNKLPLRRRKAC